MIARAAILLLALGALFAAPLGVRAAQKGASITVRARWQGTPYLLEAAEFLADESPQTYWRFVEGLGELKREPSSPAECWRATLSQAGPLVLPPVAKLLPVALGLRQYSAKLELFRQLAAQLHPNATASSCCFADVEERLIPGDDLAALEAALKAAASAKPAAGAPSAVELHAFDHVYNPQQQGAPGAAHAVVYGPPGTRCFAHMHRIARDAATASAAAGARPIVYAHRPLLGEACRSGEAPDCLFVGAEEQLVLPGYGVEAVLKNMEYSAMDDKKQKEKAAAGQQPPGAASDAAAADGDGAGDGAPLGEVKGFRLDALAARRPELRQELLTFRDALMAGEDDEAIKVWDLADAGLQATSRISQSSDPLALLQEISQGFPSIVSSLTRQQVPPSLRTAVAANQRLVSPGANILMLNGMLVEVNNFELYAFLDRLRIELRMVGQLQQAGLKPQHALQVLEERSEDVSAAAASDLRLDLAPYSKLPWLNNPEKDKRGGGQVRGGIMALMQMYPGRLRPLAANAFSLLYAGDAVSPQGLAVGRILAGMHERRLPVRIAMLPLAPDAIHRAAAARAGVGAFADPPPWKEMSPQERFARALLTLRDTFGGPAALQFWEGLAKGAEQREPASSLKSLKAAFVAAWEGAAKGPLTKKGQVAAKKAAAVAWSDLESGSGYSSEAGMALADLSAFALRKGLAQADKSVLWVNGGLHVLPEGVSDWLELEREVTYIVAGEHQFLQEQIYFGRIGEGEPLLPSIMELSTTVRRWNPAVLGGGDDDGAEEGAKKIVVAEALASPDAAALTYLHPAVEEGQVVGKGTAWGESQVYPVTHWVVADLSSQRGRALAAAALDRLLSIDDDDEVADARAALLMAPAADAATPSLLDALVARGLRAYRAAGASAADGALLRLLRALLRSPDAAALAAEPLGGAAAGKRDLPALLLPLARAAGAVPDGAAAAAAASALGGVDAAALAEAAADVDALSRLARGPLGLEPGAAAVITNGRVILDWSPRGAAGGGEAGAGGAEGLTAEDFGLMQMYAQEMQPGAAIAAAVRAAAKPYLPPRNMSDAALLAASAIGAQIYPDSRFGSLQAKQISGILGSLKGKAVRAGAPQGPDTLLQLVAITNPLTREAQRMSQVLRFVSEVLGPAASIQLHLNPKLDLSDMPLKSFYRYALPEFPRDEDGSLGLPGAPSAYLPRLPPKRVLTLNLEVPEAWMVEATKSVYDLDNLRLADVPEAVAYAEYELEALMLTGSCTEALPGGRRGAPPRGLELRLGTKAEPRRVDTLVMSNMGYFQLKASPGLWQLSVAPGRSSDIFGIVPPASGGSAAAAALASSTATYIDSFSGHHISLRVRKRPGMEEEQLLPAADGADADADAAAGGGAKGKGKAGKKGKGKASPAAVPSNDVINVITVASGHMYERLQKIMFLSVIKNTKSRVKFWIIKNYMSPHHRRVVPEMAKAYGFDYEFITYKWPHWLHKQTDKQRIIWAYKILFLDVLFPLDTGRVIFVDSDQVVRTDLAQLMTMDMKGAALAYTPFCDNNKEMDEFRFWKGGFWANHLQGKPYHISALYVIDLPRFRQAAAGDNYRIIYENLSKDPNSLANLDQDLPNYAQHKIPIHSLPQEWLWCESWCGEATKAKAKTIDLCNNPRTKEPKLQAARRIIAEWPALDEEQANFTAAVDARYAQEQAAATGEDAAVAGAGAGEQGQAAAAAAGEQGGGGGGGGGDGDDDGGSDKTEL
ncbi:UDP-glucose:glyco glucosyltransferase [Raphidocelis subcapitata]|uniref:UDP-glucose:glyco glucosyltransferase n=1 Tax=Raphidocelis subcapitata TaxID=307507 RepID=A0A2V0PEM2_9CHLO|nr:UDP-glucose:glyco glucosyltransferase [Raphidocelis subcapitata]|eukprot:GBF95627.1 UDP-glucose:glyco glucosyltransferase [Raphidocelis subcapitata]